MSINRLQEIEKEKNSLLNMLNQLDQNDYSEKDTNISTDNGYLDELNKIEDQKKHLQSILQQLDDDDTSASDPSFKSFVTTKANNKKYNQNYLRSLAKGTRNFVAGMGDPFFAGDNVGGIIDYISNNYTKPENDVEKLAEMGTRAVGSAAIALHPAVRLAATIGTAGNVLSKSDKVRQLLGKYLSMGYAPTTGNLASNVGQSLAVEKSLQQDPDNPLQAIGAGMLTGHAIEGLPKLISRNPVKNALRASLKIDPQKLEEFDKAGMFATLGDITDSANVKYLQNAVNKYGDQNNLKDITLKNIEQFKKNINLSGEENLTKAGMNALSKEEGKKLYNLAYDQYAQGEKKAFDLMKPYLEKVNPNNTKNYIEEIKNKHSSPGLKLELSTRPIGKQINTLEVDLNNMSPHEANQYKKIIGEKAHGWGIYGNKPADYELKDLYRNLKDDIETHAKKVSPEAYNTLKENNLNFERFKTDVEPWLQSLMNSKNENSVADMFLNSINRGDSNFIKFANEALPLKEQAKIKQYVFKALGTDNKGEFNFTKAFKNYSALQPEVKEALFKNIPIDQKEVIENTFKVMKNIGNRATSINTSNTAITNEIYSTFNDLGKATNEDIKPFLQRITGQLGMKWLSNNINNHEWLQSLAYANKINNKAQVPVFLNKLEKSNMLPKKTIRKLKDSFFDGIESYNKNENKYKKINKDNSNVKDVANYLAPEKLRKNYLKTEQYRDKGLSDIIAKTLLEKNEDEE